MPVIDAHITEYQAARRPRSGSVGKRSRSKPSSSAAGTAFAQTRRRGAVRSIAINLMAKALPIEKQFFALGERYVNAGRM